MTKFNKIALWALLFSVLNACVKAQKQDLYPAGAPENLRMSRNSEPVDLAGYAANLIRSDDINLDSAQDGSVQSAEMRLPNRREYSFKLCGLQDIRANNTLLGQKLKVYSELDILNNEVTIDNNNCVYWNVSLPFDYLAPAVNLDVNFIFKTTNGQKAYIHKKTLFNPWNGKRGDGPEFRDYTRAGLTEAIRMQTTAVGWEQIDAALRGEFVSMTRRLEISSVNLSLVQKNNQNFVESREMSAPVEGSADRNSSMSSLIGGNLVEQFDSLEARRRLREATSPYELYSLDLHLNVRLDNLMVRLLDSAGVNRDEQLTTGRYKIFAQLVASDMDTRGHFILSDQLLISNMQEWSQSTMGVNAVLPISIASRQQWGNLNLVLKVVPVDLPQVQPFEGVFHLGRFNDLAGGRSPLFDLSEYGMNVENNQPTFSYDDYIRRARNYNEWSQGLASRLGPNDTTMEAGFRRFLFSQLEVLFSRVMPGDTSTDRTIQYTVQTCLTDNFTGAGVQGGLRFEIEFEDRGQTYKTYRQTNDLGCLTWVGMISHKFYHREKLVHKYSKLTYVGEDSNRPEYKLDYYINPWDEKFTFGRDARQLTEEYLEQIEETQKAAPPTRVLLTSFRYDATGFRYAIDKYMNMTVKKTVLMTLNPSVLKHNSIIWGRSGMSDLRDGIYLLKVAMQKDYMDPMANKGVVVTNSMYPQKRHQGNYVSLTEEEAESIEKKQFLVVKEMLVRVLGGAIVTPVEFEIPDLRTLRIRSQMLIQIETIDEILLRSVLLANEKLGHLMSDASTGRTGQIMAYQMSLEELQREIEALNADEENRRTREYVRLVDRQSDLRYQMEQLLASMDSVTAERIFQQINEMRLLGETDVSADNNLRFRALNNALLAMRRKAQGGIAELESTVIRENERRVMDECRDVMRQFVNQGDTVVAHTEDGAPVTATELGERYNPERANQPGNLCQTYIPREELFFYLTSTGYTGTDEWFEAMLTPEEFELYKTDLLRDDFTRPYPPDFDFNLLSNQGDERIHDDGTPREQIDQNISGLPKRTFIGPVTFVLNGNGSAMRPTDVLDENRCNLTCEALGEVESQIINNTEPAREEVRRFGLPVNSAYESSPYFGSVEHFYMKHVDDLKPVYRGLKYQYHQEMNAFAQVGNFLDQFALDYVSFGTTPRQIKKLDFNCYARWKTEMEQSYANWRSGVDKTFPVSPIPQECFVPSENVISSRNFEASLDRPRDSRGLQATRLNGYTSTPVSHGDLKEFSKNGLVSKRLSVDTKINILHKMCYVLRQQLYPHTPEFRQVLQQRVRENYNLLGRLLGGSENSAYDIYLNGASTTSDSGINAIEQWCHNLVDRYASDVQQILRGNTNKELEVQILAAKSRQLPMVVERRIRVLETSNRYLYKDGKTLNYSVGTGFSTSHSFNVNRGYKLDPLEVIEKSVGNAAGLLGRFKPAGNGFSSILGAASGMINFQWGSNESQSVSDGVSVGENTNLAAQISTLDIELEKWEKCVVVRFEEQALAAQMVANLTNAIHNPSEDIQGLGYFMCSGDEDTEDDQNPGDKVVVRERYFYLNQIFNEGDMQDSGALANHPWMLQVRGMRDFGRFEEVLKAPAADIGWAAPWEFMSRDLYSAITLMSDQRHNDRSSMEVVNRADVAQALTLMQNSFNSVLPTFPGMYTYSDTPYDRVVGWPHTRHRRTAPSVVPRAGTPQRGR